MQRTDLLSNLLNQSNDNKFLQLPNKQQIIFQLIEAIGNYNIKVVSQLVLKYPILINHPLNNQGQTPLILAIQKNVREIIALLLLLGAKRNYRDLNGLTPYDYAAASFAENDLMKSLVTEGAHYILISNLKKQIHQAIHFQNVEPRRLAILQQMLEQLNHVNVEQLDSADLLDIYLTMNSIYKICCANEPLEKMMNEFLMMREEVLRGDSNDYCFNVSPANQFCYKLVQIVFPAEVSPLNVLMQRALTQNRKAPWENPETMDASLPEFGGFFRTEFDQIHLYSGILIQAIANLKRGYYNQNEIWYGTDSKSGPISPLHQSDLNILRQRSATFSTLVDYVKNLETYAANLKGSLYDRFANLGKGLARGASDDWATEPAYAAVAEFSDWWNELSKTQEGLKLQTNIRNIDYGMSRFIDQTLKDKDYCCIHGGSDVLDGLLCSNIISNGLKKLSQELDGDKKLDISVPHEQLDRWQEQILQELNSTRARITTQKNLFPTLSQSNEFKDRCLKNGLDYRHLRQPLQSLIAKPYNPKQSQSHGHSFFGKIKEKIKGTKEEINTKHHFKMI